MSEENKNKQRTFTLRILLVNGEMIDIENVKTYGLIGDPQTLYVVVEERKIYFNYILVSAAGVKDDLENVISHSAE